MSYRKNQFEVQLRNLENPARLFRSKSKVFIPASLTQKKFRNLKSQEPQCTGFKRSKRKYLYFDSEDTYIKNILVEDGWILRRNTVDCNLIWAYSLSKIPYSPQPNQRYNHFKDSWILTSKQGLNNSLSKNSSSSMGVPSFYPRTYNIEGQFLQFKNEYFFTGVLIILKKLIKEFDLIYQFNPSKRINFNRFMTGQFYKKFQQKYNPQFLYPKHLLVSLILILEKFMREREGTMRQQEIYLFHMSEEISEQLIEFSTKNIEYPDEMLATPTKDTIQILYQYHHYYNAVYPFYESDGLNNIWIIKHSEGSKGQGVHLMHNINDIRGNNNLKLVQKYIQNIFIVREDQLAGYKEDGIKKELNKLLHKKFDIRVWVLIKSVDPLIVYIYEQGIIRISSETYNLNKLKNPYIHMTNYSINKQKYTTQDESYVLLSTLNHHLKQKHCHLFLFEEIQNIIIKTLKCCDFQASKQAFELVGFDLLLDSNLKPWLLEVNMSPAFKKRGQNSILEAIKEDMARGMFELLGLIDPKDRSSHSLKRNKKWIKIMNEKSEIPLNPVEKLQTIGRNITQSELDLLETRIIKHEAISKIQKYMRLKLKKIRNAISYEEKVEIRCKSLVGLFSKLIKKEKKKGFLQIMIFAKSSHTEKSTLKRKISTTENYRKKVFSRCINR